MSQPEHRTCSWEYLAVRAVSPEVCEGTEEGTWARPFPPVPGCSGPLCPGGPTRHLSLGLHVPLSMAWQPCPTWWLSASLSLGLPREPSAGPSRGLECLECVMLAGGGFLSGSSCRSPGRGSRNEGFPQPPAVPVPAPPSGPRGSAIRAPGQELGAGCPGACRGFLSCENDWSVPSWLEASVPPCLPLCYLCVW